MSCAKSQLSVIDLAPIFFGAQEGLFCVLAFYMDDSADRERKTVFSVAGFIGETSDWFEVERHWRKRLDRENLDYFRTWECVNLEGEFQRKLVDVHGLTTARVIANALLADLKQIVSTSPIYAYSLAVLMEDYRQVLSEPEGKIVLDPDPYLQAHYQLIGIVLEAVSSFPTHQIAAFLYDEHSKAHRLQNGWETYKKSNPKWARHAGTLAPLDDKQFIPIQVADLLAHTTTKVYEQLPYDADKAKEKLTKWLPRTLMRTPYMDANYLRLVAKGNVEKFRRLRGLPSV